MAHITDCTCSTYQLTQVGCECAASWAPDLAAAIATDANKAAYAAATDKSMFVQGLIEAAGVTTYPASPLCDFVEDMLAPTNTHERLLS